MDGYGNYRTLSFSANQSMQDEITPMHRHNMVTGSPVTDGPQKIKMSVFIYNNTVVDLIVHSGLYPYKRDN